MGNYMCKAHDFAPTLRNKEASNCEPCWFQKTTYRFHSLGRPFRRRTVWMGSYSCTSNDLQAIISHQPEQYTIIVQITITESWPQQLHCLILPWYGQFCHPWITNSLKSLDTEGSWLPWKRMKYKGSFSAKWDSLRQLRLQTNQPSVTNLETWQRNSAAHNFTGEFLILVVLYSEMLRSPWCSQHSNAQISWSQPAVMLGCIRYCWRRRTDLGASEIQVDIYRS